MTLDEEVKKFVDQPAKLMVESVDGGISTELYGDAKKLVWMLTKAYGSILTGNE